jgi:hypothetical protein
VPRKNGGIKEFFSFRIMKQNAEFQLEKGPANKISTFLIGAGKSFPSARKEMEEFSCPT